MFSYIWAKFDLKNSFGKVVLNFGHVIVFAKRNETEHFFECFCFCSVFVFSFVFVFAFVFAFVLFYLFVCFLFCFVFVLFVCLFVCLFVLICFFFLFFADLWLSRVYTDTVQVSYRNSYRKVLKNGWVQVDPSPFCTNGSKNSLCTNVLNWILNVEFVEYIRRCDFRTFTVIYIKVYIFGIKFYQNCLYFEKVSQIIFLIQKFLGNA